MVEHLANILVTLNYKGAKELANKTNFHLADIIRDALYDSPNQMFDIDEYVFSIYVMPFFIDNNCNNGTFNLFVSESTHTLSAKGKRKLQKQIIDKVKLCINDINEELSKYAIPIDNLENVKFDEDEYCFYIKLGTSEPKTMIIQCSLNESDEDFAYWDY